MDNTVTLLPAPRSESPYEVCPKGGPAIEVQPSQRNLCQDLRGPYGSLLRHDRGTRDDPLPRRTILL